MGYDTSAFKVNNKVKVFELDKEKLIKDKLNRISNAEVDTTNINYIKTDFNGSWVNDLLSSNFNIEEKTFCSMLGISYYLDKDVFRNTIKELSNLVPKGSFILFDYPNTNETQKEKINKQLASGTSTKMKSIYSYSDIENIAKDSNMLIYEHLNHNDINDNYFNDYNTFNPNNKIIAPFGVSYIILIKE